MISFLLSTSWHLATRFFDAISKFHTASLRGTKKKRITDHTLFHFFFFSFSLLGNGLQFEISKKNHQDGSPFFIQGIGCYFDAIHKGLTTLFGGKLFDGLDYRRNSAQHRIGITGDRECSLQVPGSRSPGWRKRIPPRMGWDKFLSDGFDFLLLFFERRNSYGQGISDLCLVR